MHIHLVPGEDPLCPCGALLDQDAPQLCRKCRARSRWQRRAGGALRHRSRH